MTGTRNDDEKNSRRGMRSQRGTSMVEILVTLGMVTAMMGIGVLGIDRESMDAATVRQNLIRDLRQARKMATLNGTHYRVSVQGDRYVVERLTDRNGSGTWGVHESIAAQEIDLPSRVSISGSAGFVEFDARGLLVRGSSDDYGAFSLIVTDDNGGVETVRVWPSGQVEMLDSVIRSEPAV
jgi:hypothetical protein